MALAGDHVQVLVGGYELTGDYNRISIADGYDTYEVTAFGDAVHNFINGQRKIALDHVGYMNSQSARSHPVLGGVALEGIISVILGQNTAPVVGDPMHSLVGVQGKYSVMLEINKYIPFGATFANKGDQSGWGVTLTPPVSIIATTTGSAVDNGAISTNGGAAYLHLLQAAASDTYTFVVEGASDLAFTVGLVTLSTFTLNASALGSERIAVNGNIPRYLRWKATRTGSVGNTIKLAIGFVRF